MKYLGSLLLFGIVLSSCVERSVPIKFYKSGTLEVALNWADGIAPVGSRLLIYKADGTFHKEVVNAGAEQTFTCELAGGNYRVIAHNTDVLNAGFSATDKHSTAAVLAGSDKMPEEGSELVAPGNVYGVGYHDEAEMVTIVSGEKSSVTVSPRRLTHEVRFVFRIIGLEEVTELKGQLIGVSPGLLLGSGKSLPISCFQTFVGTPFTPSKAATEITYETKIEFFDLTSPKEDEKEVNKLAMSITSGNGKVYSLTANITSVIQEIIFENGGVLPIEIPLELNIEVDQKTDNITVKVTPWDNSGTGGGTPK